MRSAILTAAAFVAAAIQFTHGADAEPNKEGFAAAEASTIDDGSRLFEVIDGEYILNTTFLSLQPEDCQNAFNWMPITFSHCVYVRGNNTTSSTSTKASASSAAAAEEEEEEEGEGEGEEAIDQQNDYLDYTILLSGTGQRRQSWCEGVIQHALRLCSLADADVTERRCIRDDPWTYAAGYDPERGEFGEDVPLTGVNIGFRVLLRQRWGKNHIRDWDHARCVERAVREATCLTVNVAKFECFETNEE